MKKESSHRLLRNLYITTSAIWFLISIDNIQDEDVKIVSKILNSSACFLFAMSALMEHMSARLEEAREINQVKAEGLQLIVVPNDNDIEEENNN